AESQLIVESQPAQPVVATEPVVAPTTATRKTTKSRRSGVLNQVRFVQADMALPAPAPEMVTPKVDYPPFERQAVQVSGRKASVKELRSTAAAPAGRP
ncbi:MAG: hypothetical protein QMB70_08815, partial [Aeromonadaceae bacterium]